jgi:hypothetical protein
MAQKLKVIFTKVSPLKKFFFSNSQQWALGNQKQFVSHLM